MRYVATGPMADIALTRRLIEDYDAHQRRHGFSFWAVIERSSGTLIGDSGLYRTPAGEVELGYTLGAAVVGPRLRHRGGRPVAGGGVRRARDRRGDRARRTREPGLAARAGEAGDAARRRADRVRAPARGVPRSAAGEQGFDPVQDPLEAELEGVERPRRSAPASHTAEIVGKRSGSKYSSQNSWRSPQYCSSLTSRAACAASIALRVAPSTKKPTSSVAAIVSCGVSPMPDTASR